RNCIVGRKIGRLRLRLGRDLPVDRKLTRRLAMRINVTAAARVIPLPALLLSACVSEKTYEAQTQQLQAARAQAATEQSQIAKMQAENKWVVAGDMLFPEGGYQ